MHAQITRRFVLIAIVVLGTTILPWLAYGKILDAKLRSDLEAARAEQIALEADPSKDPRDVERRIAALEKQIRLNRYELGFGLDLKGGASITYRVRAEDAGRQDKVLENALKVMQFRLDRFGVSEVNISTIGTDQITVELPGRGKEEIDRIKDIMSTVGSLEFRIVAGDPDDPMSQRSRFYQAERAKRAEAEKDKKPYAPPPGYAWYRSDEGQDVLLETPDVEAGQKLAEAKAKFDASAKEGKPEAELAPLRAAAEEAEKAWKAARDGNWWTGDHLKSVTFEKAGMDRGGRGYEVHFAIVDARGADFGTFTGDHVRRQMAIVLNGSVHTAPVIHSKLPGSGMIYSDSRPYTLEQAQDLATVLQSGSLEVKPEEVSSFVVGPGLGVDAVRRGRWAVGISCALVIAFMAFFYRGAGWVANLAVVLNLVMTLGILMFMSAALSLPGIAGLLLTLGMAVDANILVNERIREEKAAGKGLLQAVTAGYDRAFITILDSNLTTVLTAVVLYAIGTGTIRGFALTLILGLLVSMFTALYVTRTLFLWGLEKGILTEFRMATVFGKPQIPWMGLRAPFFRASIALIVAGTAAFALRAVDEKYDLEFTGGQRVVLAFREPMPLATLKEGIAKASLGDLAVRSIRGQGADAEKLDLSTESLAYELTARKKDEAEGRAFSEQVKAAFAADLLPSGLEPLQLGPPDDAGKVPFRVVANVATPEATAEALREALQGSAVLRAAADLKVEPAKENRPKAVSFEISGKVVPAPGKETARVLPEEITEAVRRKQGLDLSEPMPQSDFIAPVVANRLRDQAMVAVLLSILAQIVYLRLRFRDFTYGFAAAIALTHDVLITLGAVAAFDALGLVHVKINLPVIAAFLTLVGYSMNDTIVVFDRIRENLGRAVHPTSALINASINQTLARSIRTSMTVLLVALVLFAVNYGATSSLEGFGFVMSVGVITGTYSSVAIASPLLLFLPVYGVRLRALGRPVAAGLMAALFVGLTIAFLQTGTTAVVGAALACLLPAHFLWHLLVWLGMPDPDGMVAALAT